METEKNVEFRKMLRISRKYPWSSVSLCSIYFPPTKPGTLS